MTKIKLEKFASLIGRELGNVILFDVRDELIKGISITHVDVSADYSVAQIYYTFLGDYERDFVQGELTKASSFLRSNLAKRLNARHTPELRFKFDSSVEHGTKIERILKELKEKEEQDK